MRPTAAVSRRDVNREIRHAMYGETARKAIGTIHKDIELFCLCKGQFSIINVIEEVLKQTGRADVIISTWTAANAEIKKAEKFLGNGLINKLHFIVDRSFKTRQVKYYDMLVEKFGNVVSETNSHAKFILISNDQWKIVIRTSMNLNENKRLENFEISNCDALFGYLSDVATEIMNVDYTYFDFKDFGTQGLLVKYRIQDGDNNHPEMEEIDFS